MANSWFSVAWWLFGWSVSGCDKFLVAVDKFWRGIFGESGLYFLIIILSQFWFGVVGLLQFLFALILVRLLVLLGCCNSCDFSARSIFFFFVVIMFGENSIIRFNGKNYASWEFQFRMFVKGKEL